MTNNLKISLRENSHNFVDEALKKAVLAEKEPIQWKYAIFSLVQSIELILKERLRKEHSVLIFQDIDNQRSTIGLDLAIDRLKKIASLKFSKNDLSAIETAKKWRNLIVHYEFEIKPIELKLVFAKLLGFSMQFNKKEFDIYLDAEVKGKYWDEALSVIEYASELYERAQKLIEEESIPKKLICDCPNCGYDTFIIQDKLNCCYVCGFSEGVFECPDCNELFFESESREYQTGDEIFEKFCSNCYERRIDEDRSDYYNKMEESYG
jgi:hypothetical protein